MMSGKFIVFVLGIVSSAACKQIYGVRLASVRKSEDRADRSQVTAWNAWDICNLILTNHATTGWRVGLALFGIVQCFGTISTNLFANSIPFGADWSGVFPKWINIIRGQVICMVFSWAICPWSILTSGAKVSQERSIMLISQFITFLGSYTVFMASFMGVLLSESEHSATRRR